MAAILAVPDGFDVKLNPRPFLADQVMVAWLMNSSPDEPGVVIGVLLVTGPFQ